MSDTLAIYTTTLQMQADEDAAERRARGQAAFEQAKADTPDEVELVYVSYGDQFTDEQLVDLLEGKPIGEIGAHFEQWESDARHHGVQSYFNELDPDVRAALDDDLESWDDYQQLLWDRDKSDPIKDLLRGTPQKYMRYWFDERELRSSELIDQVYQGIEGVGEILQTLDLLGSDQQTPELEQEIADVIAEAGTDTAIYLLWQDDVDAYIEAAGYDYGAPTPTHSFDITWKDPYLLLFNPFSGSGYADRIHCTITTTFKAENLKLDVKGGGGGYSFTDDTCGGWVSTDSDVTLTKKERP